MILLLERKNSDKVMGRSGQLLILRLKKVYNINFAFAAIAEFENGILQNLYSITAKGR